jgi:hypothetical protein
MMGKEIGRRFTQCDFQLEDQANWTLKVTTKRLCLKDDVAFALLITLSPHKVTMFNELDNFHGLDTILN